MDFVSWWQNLPTLIDPVAFQLGPIPVRWYGLMYIVAFGIAYGLIQYRLRHDKLKNIPKKQQIDDLFTWALFGILIGGRLGYILFYQTSLIWTDPLSIIWPFSNGSFTGIAGMSFHGGLIGAAIAFVYFAHKHKFRLWPLADLMVACTPLGYTFGRLGNWLNGELWGRVTDSPIGQYFINAPGNYPRHPSQLYEALGEGIILFLIIWPLRNKLKPGQATGLFLAGYALARFVIEFFRQPDAHLGFVLGNLSQGQILSALMLIAGILIYVKANKTN